MGFCDSATYPIMEQSTLQNYRFHAPLKVPKDQENQLFNSRVTVGPILDTVKNMLN